MPEILDGALVVGAMLAAGLYLSYRFARSKGCSSCGSGRKGDKLQIQLPPKQE